MDFSAEHLYDEVNFDYVAVPLSDFLVFDVALAERNRIHCLCMIGLRNLGLGQSQVTKQPFDAVLARDAGHPGATLHKRMVYDEYFPDILA